MAGDRRVPDNRCRRRELRALAAGPVSRHVVRAHRAAAGLRGVCQAIGDRGARDPHPDDAPGDHEPGAAVGSHHALQSVPGAPPAGTAGRRRRAHATRHRPRPEGRQPVERAHRDDCVHAQLHRSRSRYGRAGGQRARVPLRRGEHEDPRAPGDADGGVPPRAARERQEGAGRAGSARQRFQGAAQRRAPAADGSQPFEPGTVEHTAAAERREPDARDGSPRASRAPAGGRRAGSGGPRNLRHGRQRAGGASA